MRIEEEHDGIRALPDELERAQQNVQPHDIIRNDASVDGFLWKGTQRPSKIQQAGFIIMGGAFVVAGVSMAAGITSDFVLLPALISLAFLVAGIKVMSNAFRRRTK